MRPMLLGVIGIHMTLVTVSFIASSQEGDVSQLQRVLLHKAYIQVKKLDQKLETRMKKRLSLLRRSEARLKQALVNQDSIAAEYLFGDVDKAYSIYEQQLGEMPGNQKKLVGEYLPYLDSLQAGTLFLQQLATGSPGEQKAILADARIYLDQVEQKIHRATQLNTILDQRQQHITNYLSGHSPRQKKLFKKIAAYQQQYTSFRNQVADMKDVWQQPGELLHQALSSLKLLPGFHGFMKRYLRGNGLFASPEMTGIAGLQTREEIGQILEQQVAAGASNAGQVLQQNLQAAHAGLNTLKQQMGIQEDTVLRGNSCRHQRFRNRLEYGCNLQTMRANGFFPSTTDIGLSVGYKLNHKIVVGIGAAYKIGWGVPVRHVALSQEGVGFRSFFDYRFERHFYVTGSFEYNYQQPFKPQGITNKVNNWDQSGLLGITKVISTAAKWFAQTRLQLLWDFLSKSQYPATPPFRFRVGYAFR